MSIKMQYRATKRHAPYFQYFVISTYPGAAKSDIPNGHQSLAILGAGASAAEREVLAGIPYR